MAVEVQTPVTLDEIKSGDQIVVEVFSLDGNVYFGERRGTATYRSDLDRRCYKWNFDGMNALFSNDDENYRMFRVEPQESEEDRLERVLVIAENSESSDAILLAAEVRRLRKIEDGLKNRIAMLKQVRAALLQDVERETKLDYFYGTNGVIELREKAERIMAEVWPLEALLDGE